MEEGLEAHSLHEAQLQRLGKPAREKSEAEMAVSEMWKRWTGTHWGLSLSVTL